MDYKEEQSQELDALASIYPSELTVETEEFPQSFSIVISSDNFNPDEDEAAGVSATVLFTYSQKYPEEPPVMEFEDSTNIEDFDLTELLDYLNDQAAENLGMPMVFTLVSGLQEQLNLLVERVSRRKQDELERRKAEEEERERKRLEGTRVTVQSFLDWKEKFDAERKRLKGADAVDLSGRLTGKEQFLRDATLGLSDIKLLAEEGDVPIDESLFEDLDDLDIEDDNIEEDN